MVILPSLRRSLCVCVVRDTCNPNIHSVALSDTHLRKDCSVLGSSQVHHDQTAAICVTTVQLTHNCAKKIKDKTAGAIVYIHS